MTAITFVIPAYNAAATLGEALASLEAQTREDWCAVVVDDGSTDTSGQVAAAHAARDPRVSVVSQQNAGESAARNAGLDVAITPWVAFLDSDDWLAPEFVERMLGTLDGDPSLDAVHCRYARVAVDGTHTVDDYTPPTGDMFAVWAHRSAFPVHACVVRRALVDEVGRFDTDLERSADWDLWQRIARTGAQFGRVDEVLAFYRTRPGGVSLDAALVLRDGMVVLRRGHARDPRVPRPHPDHAEGEPPGGVEAQAYYLATWCAGVAIGSGGEGVPLLEQLGPVGRQELAADAIASTLFESILLPSATAPSHWHRRSAKVAAAVERYLEQLEAKSGTTTLTENVMALMSGLAWEHSPPGLDRSARAEAAREHASLEHVAALRDQEAMIERQSERAGALQRTIDEQSARMAALQRTIDDHAATIRAQQAAADADRATLIEQAATIERLETSRAADALAAEQQAARDRDALEAARQRAAQLGSELDAVRQGEERRVGEFVLHRLRLRGPLRLVAAGARHLAHGWTMLRARVDGLAAEPRVLATVCTDFPIYSQTFVHQELVSMLAGGFSVKVAYSVDNGRKALGGRFEELWPRRRRLVREHGIHLRHQAHYARRMPERVEQVYAMLAEASGFDRDAVAAHDNVLQAFTFARIAETSRAQYLHSYFFYDRSLMALVAAHLLDLPRGISCYADHLLDDYPLKVVPLHLERASVVVATSARIREELLGLAPGVDDRKIIVKPNGIDTTTFPVVERHAPGAEPWRVVTVCRIEPKKGLVDLVEAIALLRARGVRVEAHIVGTVDEWSEASREYKARLDERITELGLWGTVHLEGRQDVAGVRRFHAIGHVFVAPFVELSSGDKDGIPTALLEAMASGMPVVASNAGSMEEVIRDGHEGLVVPQRDPVALADAIGALTRDDTFRAAAGAAAAATVRARFDVATCERSLHERIRAALAESRRG